MTLHRLRPAVQPAAAVLRHLKTSWHSVLTIPTRLSNAFSGPVATTGLGLGTADAWVVRRGQGLVSFGPSCLAVETSPTSGARTLRCAGLDARRLEGLEPAGIELSRPIAGGRVQRRDDAVSLVRHYLKAGGRFGQKVVLAVPHGLTVAERRTLEQVVLGAGARQVYLVEEALAAGLGAGLKVLEAHSVMSIDMGASSTRVTVMALGEVAESAILPLGGNAMDTAIQAHLAQVHHLKVGLGTAERVKRQLGCALPLEPEQTMAVDGMSLTSELPTRVEINSTEICLALQPVLTAIADHLWKTLEGMQPQVIADITASPDGIALIGGGARLAQMGEFLRQRARIDVKLLAEPEQALASGIDYLLKNRSVRRTLLSAPSNAVPVRTRETVRRTHWLAWTLGALAVLLVWQMSGPVLARTTGVDKTLTALMVPVWRSFSHVGPHNASALVVEDPAQRRLRLQLRDTQRRLQALSTENKHLRGLVHMRGTAPSASVMTAGQVVARDPGAWLQTLVLDIGRQSHLAPGMPVMADNGLVGHIADVSATSSRIETLTYKGATTAAIISKRHAAGVVYGVDGRTCEMRYLDPNSGVKNGDLVTTSGSDRYPEGLPVGHVTMIHPSTDGVSVTAVVRPIVPLDTVRDVLVVQGKK